MTNYELTILVDPALNDLTGIESIINKHATIIKLIDEGVKQSRYPIENLDHHHYYTYKINFNDHDAERALYESIRINDQVLRFLIIKCDPKFNK